MRELFLANPVLLAFVVSSTVVLLCIAADQLAFRLPMFRILETQPLVGPFFVAAASIFALYLAFVAADTWRLDGVARSALQSESGAAERIGYATASLGAEGDPIRRALAVYIDTTLAEEWAATLNRRSAPAAGAALGSLETAVVRVHQDCLNGVRPPPCLQVALAQSLLGAVDQLHDARSARLSAASHYGSLLRWSTLMALGFVSLLSIGLVHRDRRAPARIAIGLFGSSMAFALTIVALQEFPYAGADPVTPGSLHEVRRTL